MAAPGGLGNSTIYQQHHRASVSSPSGAPVAPAGPTGDTASTGGFVDPTSTGGGLQTSPNVPAPGTSINPATGKPHTAGLTRAELQAIRAKGADLLDPSPQTEAVRRGSSPPSTTTPQFGVLGGVGTGASQERRLSELSGKEQAARQLTGTANTAGAPVTAPGTAPNAPSSIIEEVTTTLDKVGRTAYNVLPVSVKEVLSASPNPPAGPTPHERKISNASQRRVSVVSQRKISNASDTSPTSTTGRRNSVMMFFDKVKTDGEKIAKDIQANLATVERKPSEIKQGERATGVIGSEGGLLTQMKNMWNEVSSTPAGGATGATSLPSQEVAGAKPGDRSGGAGALPGGVGEKGVAVLPDEKAATGGALASTGSASASTAAKSLPSQENQGMLPGEISAGAGALPGKSSEAGVAIPPDVRKEEGSAGGLLATGAAVAGAGTVAGAALASTHGSHDSTAAQTSSTNTGLAPALPQTSVGQGAAQGATDLGNTPGATTPSTTHSLAPQTLHADDRTTSMASITAIHKGHEGQRSSDEVKQSSPLAATSITAAEVPSATSTPASAPPTGETHAPAAAPTSAESHGATTAAATGAAAVGAAGAAGAAAASHDSTHTPAAAPITEQTHVDKKNPAVGDNLSSSTGTPASTLTKSETPGEVHQAVGHPATRDQDGTSREPGSYPAADYGGKAVSPKEAAKEESGGGAGATGAVGAAGAAGAAGATGAAGAAGATGSGRHSLDTAVDDSNGNGKTADAARRKSSSASNGGKKVGFMKKLKGEMKVLGGKLTHDDEKVQEGEKLKHGDL